MPRYAIDAPTLMRLVGEDIRVSPAHQLVAPKSILMEGMEILLADVRAGRLDEQGALRVHVRMTETKIRLLGDRVSRRTALELALQNGWATVREAEYVAVAMLQADALIAGGPEMASKASGIIPLARFEALLAT